MTQGKVAPAKTRYAFARRLNLPKHGAFPGVFQRRNFMASTRWINLRPLARSNVATTSDMHVDSSYCLMGRPSASTEQGVIVAMAVAVFRVADRWIETAVQFDRGEFFVGHVLNQRVDHHRLRRNVRPGFADQSLCAEAYSISSAAGVGVGFARYGVNGSGLDGIPGRVPVFLYL